MKKPATKTVALRSETLRRLQDEPLHQVQGGHFAPPTFSCPPLQGPSSKC